MGKNEDHTRRLPIEMMLFVDGLVQPWSVKQQMSPIEEEIFDQDKDQQLKDDGRERGNLFVDLNFAIEI